MNADLLAQAVKVAEEMAAPVFPVRVSADLDHPGKTKKRPLVAAWQAEGAVMNPEAIEELFAACPSATHVGIRTGDGLLVVDLDGEDGQRWWAEHADLLPVTRTQRTQREGGLHLYYRIPRDCVLTNSAGKLAPAVDIRATGGFVVDWSALHPPECDDMTDAPAALIELIRGKSTPPLSTLNGGHKVSQGGRHDALKRTAASMRRRGLSGNVLLAALSAWNLEHCSPPQDERDVARLASDFTVKEGDELPSAEDWSSPSVCTYGSGFDAAHIPRRRWLLGHRRSIGEVTIDAGPPGVNKSTLQVSDAVQIVTGRQILSDVVHEQGEVLLLAGEDAKRDVEARLAGVLARFHITPAELGGRLHVVYLGEISPVAYTLAQMSADMASLNTRMLEWLRDLPRVVAVLIDPIAAWHRLTENSNEALQLLSSALRAIAVQGNRHVGFNHHITKVSQFDCEGHVGNLNAVRGASAIMAAARWAFTLARLKPETAAAHGIPEGQRKLYRRLDALKTSYGPDDDAARLLVVESVAIANGESVGVLVEVDTDRTRAEAADRKEEAAKQSANQLAEALTRMLLEERRRTANAAALWLVTRCPTLLLNKKGEPLSEFSVRRRLPALIGAGIHTTLNGNPARIVFAGHGQGKASVIDFAQVGLPS